MSFAQVHCEGNFKLFRHSELNAPLFYKKMYKYRYLEKVLPITIFFLKGTGRTSLQKSLTLMMVSNFSRASFVSISFGGSGGTKRSYFLFRSLRNTLIDGGSCLYVPVLKTSIAVNKSWEVNWEALS